jgi:arabinan endo-1,5-alpha-L-arabinosidase
MVVSAKVLTFCLLSVCLLSLAACGTSAGIVGAAGTSSGSAGLSYGPSPSSSLATYTQTGNTEPVHDPSIIRQANTWYSFTSDNLSQISNGFLPVRCSQDKLNWAVCGTVFQKMPAWMTAKVPGALCLWAPDISYFNGLYHLYYAASTTGSQLSVIGLATTTTLDASDPNYRWVDQGEVLGSQKGNDFNAIDPNILVDTDGSVWLTYGSYWSGIKQREIDPATGLLSASNTTRYDLATRPGVSGDPIEGSSLAHYGDYYYLFVSVDFCCNSNPATDNYKEAVGRSASPHGPFVDMQGTPMMQGGGTVILQGNGTWNAPGGGTVYVDETSQESLIVFHALQMSQNAAPHLWVKDISWQNGWPLVQ